MQINFIKKLHGIKIIRLWITFRQIIFSSPRPPDRRQVDTDGRCCNCGVGIFFFVGWRFLCIFAALFGGETIYFTMAAIHSMAMDKRSHCDKTEAMKSLEERVTTLETSLLTMANAIYAMIQNNMGAELPKPPPRLPFEWEEGTVLLTARTLHFGLDATRRAHWADVYSRLVAEKKIHADEVTSMNFTYLMCGEGTPAIGPIRWYGSTRELAYMVRRHLNSRWEVALVSFKDKNDNPLPKTLKNTKAPSDQNMKKIDHIFRTKD